MHKRPTPPLSEFLRRDRFSGHDKHSFPLPNGQVARIRAKGRGIRDEHGGAPVAPSLSDPNLSVNTLRGYQADLAHFIKSGGRLPCSADMIVAYLDDRGEWLSIATLTRRLMAIRHAHVELGLPSPTGDPMVKQRLRALRRKRGVAQRQAKPLSRKLLRRIVCSMGHSLIDKRDRALLLLGFGGGFRRSELVALNTYDLDPTEEGVIVTIRRSKTDQEGAGRKVAIPAVGGKLCPARALKRWILSARISAIPGPIFRSFDRGGAVTDKRLSAAYVSKMLKKRLRALDVDPSPYSAHSLRAGLVTEAARAGVPSWKIRQQTGHRSEATLARYIRDADLWRNNSAVAAFGARRRALSKSEH